MSQDKAREFWISEAHELPPPTPYVDKDVDDCIYESAPSAESPRKNWVHVIEHSAYLEAIARAEAAERNAKLAAEVDSDSCETIAALQEQLAAVTAHREVLLESNMRLSIEVGQARVLLDEMRTILDDLCTTNDYEFPYRVPELIERAIKQRKDIK